MVYNPTDFYHVLNAYNAERFTPIVLFTLRTANKESAHIPWLLGLDQLPKLSGTI